MTIGTSLESITKGFFIQPLTVFNPQSPAHVTSVAVALVKEDNATLRSVLVETKLDDVLYQLERTMFVVNGAVVPGDYQLCGDWISLHAELDTDVSNSRDADALTCYSCWIQKSELKETWLEAPFQYYKPCRTMADFPNSALPGVPLYKRRYCWMHGVTRLTSTTLGHLYGTIPARDALKNEFRAIMDSVHPDWTEDANLQCKEMKQLLRGGQPVLLSSLFDTRAVEAYPWPTEQRSVDFTPREMAELVLCSLRVYHDFAYTKWPSAQAFLTLWHARQALLAFYAGKRLPLTPTSHFMFNEALHFVENRPHQGGSTANSPGLRYLCACRGQWAAISRYLHLPKEEGALSFGIFPGEQGGAISQEEQRISRLSLGSCHISCKPAEVECF